MLKIHPAKGSSFCLGASWKRLQHPCKCGHRFWSSQKPRSFVEVLLCFTNTNQTASSSRHALHAHAFAWKTLAIQTTGTWFFSNLHATRIEKMPPPKMTKHTGLQEYLWKQQFYGHASRATSPRQLFSPKEDEWLLRLHFSVGRKKDLGDQSMVVQKGSVCRYFRKDLRSKKTRSI